jgi:hypothetical protein
MWRPWRFWCALHCTVGRGGGRWAEGVCVCVYFYVMLHVPRINTPTCSSCQTKSSLVLVFKVFKMPNTSYSHEACREKVCLICVTKKKDVRPISPATHLLIDEHYLTGLNYETDLRLPVVICSNCRSALSSIAMAKKRHHLPPVFDYRELYCLCYLYNPGTPI